MIQYSRYFRSFLVALSTLAAPALSQSIRPLTGRIDAIVAHPLVLPVHVDDPKSIDTDLRVRLDDGRSVQANAYFIWASKTGSSTGWTRGTPLWHLLTTDQFSKSPPKASGTWIVMIDLPIDAVGQGIWIDETRYAPNWLPSPMRVILETSSRAHDGFWSPALSDAHQDSPYIRDALSNLSADPFNRWRAQLLSKGFSPDLSTDTNPVTTDRDLTAIHTELLQSDTSHVLDDIAEHFAARWQIILGRIWLIDPAVAHRLKHQLTRTASADGHLIPLWTDDTAQLSALAHDLLSPFVNDELRVERVVAWLDSQPSSMSWIIDDSGHPSRDPFHLTPEIGLFQISDQPTRDSAGLIRIQSQGIAPHVLTVPSNMLTNTTLVTPTAAVPNYAQANDPRQINVQIGRQRSTLNSNADIPLASPPGVLVGPLLSDWTLNAFGSRQSGLGALPPTNQHVAGLVHRIADLNEPDPRIGWRLYLECVLDPDASSTDSEVQVWIGPMKSTRVSWTISRLIGLVEMSSDPDIDFDSDFKAITVDDRWIIELMIPPNAISPDGFLTLGIERSDGDAHSSWPRRMMPWQSEPGRYTIDVTGWIGPDQSP